MTRAVEADGFFYAPDPSSQQVCTIGGNVAENSGGAHCLKNGFTVNHVTGLVVVLPDGELVELGGKALDPDGCDLLGAFVGSEGTLGIATEITLRLMRKPETVTTQLAAFRSIDDAGSAVSGIIAAGIVPAAIEMMDKLTIDAAEAAYHPGYPDGAEAVLLVELDGVTVQVEEDTAAVDRICRGARGVRGQGRAGRRRARAALARPQGRVPGDGPDVARLLRPGRRRAAHEAAGGAAPDRRAREEHGLRVGNVFHAGDGNLHPLVLYDAAKGETEAAEGAGRGDPRRVPRRRRLAHGRARRRRRQGVLDAEDVLGARPRDIRAAAPGVRPGRAGEPGEGVADAAALRRGAGPVPHASAGEAGPCRAFLASSRLETRSAVLAATAEAGHVRIGHDLDTSGLDRILEHEAGDLTCTVEAGIRLSALRAALARHEQRLSLDPPGDPTIGACLAANLSGPLRHRFGAPRDLVLGVTLVLADGTIANAGGKVVKNVAGYDLGKLFCGSRGTLALIARVSLRLHPMPTAAGTVVVETLDAAATVSSLMRSQLAPSALDVLHPGRVAVLFEGGAAAVEATRCDARIAPVGGERADDVVWDEARRRQGAARGKARFSPGELVATLAELEEAVVRPAAGVAYVPHATADETPDAVHALNERVRAQRSSTRRGRPCSSRRPSPSNRL